jgi:branched-chain amino acid transport system substrate-binding protein
MRIHQNVYKICVMTVVIMFLSLNFACQQENAEKPSAEKTVEVKLSEQTSMPTQEKTEVNIGACLPLTGPVASYGERARKGMELAVQELDARGGSPLRLIFEDNRGKTPVAVMATQKLIDLNKVPAVVGSAASSVTMAMTSIGNKRNVVIFSPIASSPELSTKGGDYFFRVAPSDTAQATVMANWFEELGIKKIAVLYFANTWGQSLFEAVKKDIESSGGKVVVSDGIQEGQADFRTQIEKFKRSQAEAFYVITHGKEGGIFVKQARQLQVKVPMFGGDVWSSPEFTEVGGKATEGCRLVAPAKLAGPKYERFASKFEKNYGERPEVYAAYSYDTIMILAQAVNSGATTGKTIRNYLLNMSPYQGVSGEIQFDRHGDKVGGGFDRYQIFEGRLQVAN